MNIGGSISGALFNDKERKYRYALWRIWDRQKGTVLFIGLNPSTANDTKDDPTIVRLVNFAKAWGYGGLYAGNLFSIVSANPASLFFESSCEFVGGPNDEAIERMRELAAIVLVGWGKWGKHAGLTVSHTLSLVGEPVYCLKINKSGEPCHPLYLPATSNIFQYHRKTTST